MTAVLPFLLTTCFRVLLYDLRSMVPTSLDGSGPGFVKENIQVEVLSHRQSEQSQRSVHDANTPHDRC